LLLLFTPRDVGVRLGAFDGASLGMDVVSETSIGISLPPPTRSMNDDDGAKVVPVPEFIIALGVSVGPDDGA